MGDGGGGEGGFQSSSLATREAWLPFQSKSQVPRLFRATTVWKSNKHLSEKTGCTLGFGLRVTQVAGYSSHSETPDAKRGVWVCGESVPSLNSIPLKSSAKHGKADGSRLVTSGGLLALFAYLEPLRRETSTSAFSRSRQELE